MTETQVTEKQHYVPAFYLKRFADADEMVQVFDPRGKRIEKPRQYSSVCYGKFFYAQKEGQNDDISQVFEDAFGKVETRFSGQLPGIIERLLSKTATDGDFRHIAYFMATQWMRSPKLRKTINRLQEEQAKHRLKFSVTREGIQKVAERLGVVLTDANIDEQLRMVRNGEYSLKYDNAAHLDFMSVARIETALEQLYANQWNIITASGEFGFITTDNPVAEWIPHDGPWEPPFSHRKHYFAICPKILIETDAPLKGAEELSPSKTAVYREADSDETLMFEMVLANFCHQFCYAPTRKEFEEMLREQAAPGSAMKMYLERYWS